MPVTTPEELIVAIAVVLLLHVPPAVISLSAVVAPPAQTFVIPVIPAGVIGNGFTVSVIITEALPQLLIFV